jgi:hypothetical protein
MALQIRRGTDVGRQALSGVNTPLQGEPLYTTDTKKLFIGDGVTAGGTSLGYYSNVAVAGQTTLSAINNTETLTLIAGNNVVLATDGPNDSVTISVATTLNELNNGNIRIINNNINGIVSNENINIDPSGTGKVVVNSPVNALGVETNSLQVGAFDSEPTTYYFEVEGPSIERVFRAGGPGGIVGAEFSAYYASPANDQKGLELRFRQSTAISSNFVVGTINTVVTDISAGAVDSKFDFTVKNNNTNVTSASIDGSGFVGNLAGNVTGNLLGDVTGNVTGIITGTTGSTISGTLTGIFETEKIRIFDDIITTLNSNEDINISPSGTGVVIVPTTVKAVRLEATQFPLTSGISTVSAAPTNSSIVIGVAHDTASTSVNPGILGDTGPYTGSTLMFVRSRNLPLSPNSVQSGDEISTIDFVGFTGSSFTSTSRIRGVVDNISGSNISGKIEFTASDISGNNVTRLTVNSAAITSTVPFKLPIYADPTTRDAAITSPDSGMIILLTDSTGIGGPPKYQGFIAGTGWVDLN